MKEKVRVLYRSENGQAATEYMFMIILYVTLAMIGFIIVPFFADGFNFLLERILDSSYDPSVK